MMEIDVYKKKKNFYGFKLCKSYWVYIFKYILL